MINAEKVDLGTLVLVGVVLDRSTPDSFAEFEGAVSQISSILDCYLVAGDFDYFLKIRVRDMAEFNRLHATKLRWIREGRWEAMNHILVILSREQDGRDATPSVGIIDSQSVKTAENSGPRGYDAGKKIKGRKRHIATDTLGHVVAAVVHPADIQDRDGAPLVAARIRSVFPWLRHLIGDGGYAGEKLRGALAELGRWTIEIVKRSDRAEGFVVLPKRWIVERSFAWLGRCRRLTRDVETTISSSHAWLMIAHIRRVLRKINQTAF